MCNVKCWKDVWFNRKNYWFFRDYSFLLSEAKYKAKYGSGLKILTPNQMLQRLPIVHAQVKPGMYSNVYIVLYCAKEITKNVCNNIMIQ